MMHHVTIGFAGFVFATTELCNEITCDSRAKSSSTRCTNLSFSLHFHISLLFVLLLTAHLERCDNRASDPRCAVVSIPLHDVTPAGKPKSFIARFQPKASSAKISPAKCELSKSISHLSISTMIFDVIRRALLPFPLSSPSVFSMISTRTHRAKVLKILRCSSHLSFLLAFLVAVLVIILR